MERVLKEKFVAQKFQGNTSNIFVYLLEGRAGKDVLNRRKQVLISDGIEADSYRDRNQIAESNRQKNLQPETNYFPEPKSPEKNKYSHY